MNKIRDLREDKDMTQSQLASILGVTTMTLSRWERGYTEVPVMEAFKLSQFFHVPVEEIFDVKPFTPKIVYKEIDNIYQYVISNLNSFTNSELLRIQGAIEQTLLNRSNISSSPSITKPGKEIFKKSN